MKVGYYGLRAQGVSLLSIVLMCATVFVWTWKGTPTLSTLPVQGRFELAQDVQWDVPGVGWGGDDVVSETIQEHREEETNKAVSRLEDKVISEVRREEETDTREEETAHDVSSMKETKEKISRNEGTRTEERTKEVSSIKERKEKTSRNEGTITEERSNTEITKEGEGNDKRQRKRKQNKEIEKEISSSVGFEERSSKVRKTEACNYAKGKWVVDHNQTLYSGFGCKQWLSEMWSCRLTRRTDFAYENLRWQPKHCQLERFEESKFLKRLRNKTLAFVGDSLGRQQFQSLICMITGGKERSDIVEVGEEYGITRAHGNARADGWAFRFPATNTTVLYYWSASLCDIQPLNLTNPKTEYAMHLDRPALFLTQNIHRIHVLVLNTAHHWNRGKLRANRWVMHVNGELNTNKRLQEIWKARNLTVHSVVKWADAQLPKYPGLKVFYRTISPRHFVGGDWNTGGSCDNTAPMSIEKEIISDESGDSIAGSAVAGTGVKLLDITAISGLRDEAHVSRFRGPVNSTYSDCLHWCLPGIPDTWNQILFAQL